MEPVTKTEKYLASIAGESVKLPEPVTRKEKYLSAIATGEGEVPAPVTKEEMYLKAILDNGGGSGGSTDPLDPKEIYKDTRPKDWLPMPEPQDDEMYLLFHVYDGVSGLIAFTVTCAGNYTVQTGTVINGKFVDQTAESFESGSKYEAEYHADDYGDLTSTGMKQVMVKVSGSAIKTWEPSIHTRKPYPSNFSDWNIVEISCRMPQAEKVICGSSIENKSLRNLRYFGMYGENMISSAFRMFQACTSLVTILSIDMSSTTDCRYMFSGCNSLISVPELHLSDGTSGAYMFFNCFSLKAIPKLETPSFVGTNYMFSGCNSLISVTDLDVSNVANLPDMFGYCSSLISVTDLDISNGTSFYGSFLLSKITLRSSKEWSGRELSVGSCSLGRKSLVDLFESLPIATNNPTLIIGGNPGLFDLTDEDRAIATRKGWTLNEVQTQELAPGESPVPFGGNVVL